MSDPSLNPSGKTWFEVILYLMKLKPTVCAKCVFACAKSANMCVDKMELATRGAPINQTCLKVAEKLTRESSSRAIIQFCKAYWLYFTLYSDLQNRQRGKTSKTKNGEERQSDSKLESLSLKWFVVYKCCWIWTPLLFNVKNKNKERRLCVRKESVRLCRHCGKNCSNR